MKLNRLLRRCLAGICTLALLAPQSLVFTAAAQPQQSTKASAMRNAIAAPSAQEYWNLLSGWTDYSTEGNIAFQNNSDQADFATYRPDIDGTAGFKIDFRIDFPEPEVESTARIVLSAESHYNHFFNIMLTGKNNQVTMNVGFFNGDTWASPVVENTGEMTYNGGLRIVISREENSKYIRFALCDTEGNVLIDKKATDPVYQAQKFLDSSDLKLQVCTVAGGNVFRFSDLHLEAFPDDGVSDEPSAAELWTMPNGWESSAENGEAVLHYKEGTERNIYKPTYYVNCDFRLSFVVTPETQESTAFFCSIFTPGQSAYLRLTCQYNPSGPGFQASESLSLCMGEEYGYGWKTLGGTPWNWTGSAYRVTLAWDYSEQKLTLTRSAVEGDTVEHTVELSLPLMGDDETLFFTLCGDEEMHLDCNSLETAAFALSDFSLQNSKSAAEEWTMPAGWMDVSSVDEVAFCDSGATEQNRRIEALEAMRGFDIRYAAKFNGEARLDAVLVNAYEKGLRVRLSGNQTDTVLEVSEHGTDRLLAKSDAVDTETVYVHLIRQAGSSTLYAALETVDGSALWQTRITDADITALNFFDVSALNFSFMPGGNVTVSSIQVKDALRPAAEQTLYDLGAGWTAYEDDDGELYLVKSDGRENEAVLRSSIDGSKGFRIEYDITYFTERLTTTYVKIGVLDGGERLFFSRIKGENGTVIAQGQVYNDGDWTGNLLSAAAGERKQTGGTVHVLIERQQGSKALRFVLSLPDGTVLSESTVMHDALGRSVLDNENVRFILGRDSDSAPFRISNISVTEYPVNPVAVTGVEISGETELILGQSVNLRVQTVPDNATLRTIQWKLDGQPCGSDEMLTVSPETVGTHTLTLTVTDYSGNEKTTSETISVKPVPAGKCDADLNGTIDEQDAALILRQSVGLAELTQQQRDAADVNGDGKITSSDARRVALQAQIPEKRSVVSEKRDTNDNIAAPEHLEYLWNGTAVNDRSNFGLAIHDWLLGTTYGYPAQIEAGGAGTGVTYKRAMGDWWYAGGDITLTKDASAEVSFLSETAELTLCLTRTGDSVKVALLDQDDLLMDCGTAQGDTTFSWIVDNTRDGAELRIHITGNQGFAAHRCLSPLSAGQKELLSDTIGMAFSTKGADNAAAFTELCINDLRDPFENDAAALAYLESENARIVPAATAVTSDGRTVGTCDISGNYNAVWARDVWLGATYAPDYYSTEVLINTLDFTLEHVRPSDGWIPDHVEFNGQIAMAAGDIDKQIAPAQLDTAQTAVMMMNAILLKLPEAERDAYFSKWEATIMNALQLLPLDENGLVYNDPAIQYSTFGLIDCIAVNGSVLEASTLLWKAYTLMAQWQTALGHDSTEAHLAAKRIEESLERTFYNEEYGLLNAATGDNCQPDILGTILTVSLGFPLSEKARTEIARYLCEHYDEIVQYGYVRHLPGGTYWEKKITLVPPDQYMDGAYWAPFTGWFVDAIKDYDPALAQRTVKNLITYGYYHGFYECINGKDGKLRDYVNSVTNVLTVARELLTVSAETVTIEGDTSLITGQEGNFAAVVRPENATIRSIAWLLDDEQIGEGMTLHYSFLQPGSYTLSLVVTDTNGTESRSETTVMVEDLPRGSVEAILPAISGKSGDVVSVPIMLSHAVTSAEWSIAYDASLLEPIACGVEDSLYAQPGELLTGGRLASNCSDGKMLLSMYTITPLQGEGCLFTVQFKLLADIEVPIALQLTAAECFTDDDTLVRPTDVEVHIEGMRAAEYTVTFIDGLTGETIATDAVEEGNAATAPKAPEHEGYTFKGWDKDFSNVTADLTVTAQYKKNEEPPKPTEYTVTFVDGLTSETISTVKVEEGNAATAPEAPEHEGYTFKGWDKDFSNVTADLTVTAQYEKNEEPPKPWVNPFKDVKESDWFYEGVKFAALNGLFDGTSPTTFEPDSNMTRAMLVTVLWRLDGKPAPKSMNSFKDVPSGQWYTEAVAWASENGVVDGVGNNLFDPDGNVTREQIAAIMYRYAGKKGYDTTKRADLSKYPDAGQISSYAKEALSWANAEGLINGTNNGKGDILDPKGSATRAQVATILMRYVENIVQK